MAGTGKSTIAHTIAAELDEKTDLGASFFFSRGVGQLANAALFVTILAHQLADRIPVLRPCISEAVTRNPGIVQQDMRKQWKELIVQSIKKITTQYRTVIVVIDALDECGCANDMKLILQLLIELKGFSSMRLGVIVTSRPETPIQLGFKTMPEIIHQNLVLHDVEQRIVEHDVLIFLETEFARIRKEQGLEDWPSEEQIRTVLKASNCLFIYAATVCCFVGEPSALLPEERLAMILQSSATNMYPTANLDEMYIQVLRAHTGVKTSMEDKERFKQVVGSIIVLYDVLSLTDISSLLGLFTRQVRAALNSLHSLLHIPDNPHSPIRLLHPSFRDFLLDRDRCSDLQFWVDRTIAGRDLASACLRLMTRYLVTNICQLREPSAAPSGIQREILSNHFSKALQYASLYWVDHLEQASCEQRVEVGLCDNGEVDEFFQ